MVALPVDGPRRVSTVYLLVAADGTLNRATIVDNSDGYFALLREARTLGALLVPLHPLHDFRTGPAGTAGEGVE